MRIVRREITKEIFFNRISSAEIGLAESFVQSHKNVSYYVSLFVFPFKVRYSIHADSAMGGTTGCRFHPKECH